jgi:hypothetical protein
MPASDPGTLLEKTGEWEEFFLPTTKEVLMVNRDNRPNPGQGGQTSQQDPGKSKGQTPRTDEKGQPGQSKQTQGNPSSSRNEQGTTEGGRPGSQGKPGSKSDENDDNA